MSNDINATEFTVNGLVYVPKGSDVQAPIKGKRAVFVIDRGWMVAGDVTETADANGKVRIRLTRALHVFKFDAVGFQGMIDNPKKNTDLRPMKNGFDIPEGSEIFRVWVCDGW